MRPVASVDVHQDSGRRAHHGEKEVFGMGQWRYRREFVALGAAVRELRARRRLTQEQLGFAAGVHRNHVGAIERGEINPTFFTLMLLVYALDASFADLVETFDAQCTWRPKAPQTSTGLRGLVSGPQR
jgi:DNA-binding XRE family transcriptional regulator